MFAALGVALGDDGSWRELVRPLQDLIARARRIISVHFKGWKQWLVHGLNSHCSGMLGWLQVAVAPTLVRMSWSVRCVYGRETWSSTRSEEEENVDRVLCVLQDLLERVGQKK